MAASQKINRAALDIFILLVFFPCASVRDLFCVEPQLTLRGSVPGILGKRLRRTQGEFLAE
jgi:hypothetical protein